MEAVPQPTIKKIATYFAASLFWIIGLTIALIKTFSTISLLYIIIRTSCQLLNFWNSKLLRPHLWLVRSRMEANLGFAPVYHHLLPRLLILLLFFLKKHHFHYYCRPSPCSTTNLFRHYFLLSNCDIELYFHQHH
jgi:hypothetical protein